jgi:hypothetical protein
MIGCQYEEGRMDKLVIEDCRTLSGRGMLYFPKEIMPPHVTGRTES